MGAIVPVTPALARRKPKKSLIASLISLVRTRDSLADLKTSIEDGSTNRDLRRIMSVLLTGAQLPVTVREAVLWLPQPEADNAEIFGKEAIEYLDQIIAYEDPMDSSARPQSETLQFAVKCVEAAGLKLDKLLMYFPSTEVDNARQQLTMDVTPQQ
jgi:hypothetical protein